MCFQVDVCSIINIQPFLPLCTSSLLFRQRCRNERLLIYSHFHRLMFVLSNKLSKYQFASLHTISFSVSIQRHLQSCSFADNKETPHHASHARSERSAKLIRKKFGEHLTFSIVIAVIKSVLVVPVRRLSRYK